VRIAGRLGSQRVETTYSPCDEGRDVVTRWAALRALAPPPAPPPRSELRRRPLRVPRAPAACPNPTSHALGLPLEIPAEAALGFGPVHPVSRAIPRLLDFVPPEPGSEFARRGWRANETLWLSEPSYRGPALVRGRSLDRLERLGFGVRARPDWELWLPAGAWDEADPPLRIWGREVSPPAGWRLRMVPTRVHESARSECYFVQIDGESFSEAIVFGIQIQP
jgi:hypothetical protein